MISIEQLIVELYETNTLRGVRDALRARGVEVSHETVRSVCAKAGVLRGRNEAAMRRRLYPRKWRCHVCEVEKMVEDHKAYRRQTCSPECAERLRRYRSSSHG